MISGIVLAAGTSSRFGRTKQLVELDGKPLVQHAIDAAAEAGLDEIAVVLGHDADRVLAAISLPSNSHVVLNLRFEEGQSTSLSAGLAALDPTSEGAVVLLADQPGITPDMIRVLLEPGRRSRAVVVRLRFRDGPGPALLLRDVWDEVGRIEGDAGARELIDAHPDWVEEVDVDADAPPDVDAPGDYDHLTDGGSLVE